MPSKIVEQLSLLSKKFESVKTYKPANLKLIMRSEGNLPGYFPNELKKIYLFSNGASILDYCLVGCKNRDLVDIAENNMELWAVNNFLVNEFVGFMTNSIGENFGYLSMVKSKFDNFPVSFLKNIDDQCLLIIASSIGIFFKRFFEEIEKTLSVSTDSLYIIKKNWPLDLSYWLREDPELVNMYKSGVLEKYYSNDKKLNKYIDECLDSL